MVSKSVFLSCICYDIVCLTVHLMFYFLLSQDIAEVVYTVRDVVDEIRDAATKQRLRVLPYEIKMMEPSPDAIVRGNYCHYCLES